MTGNTAVIGLRARVLSEFFFAEFILLLYNSGNVAKIVYFRENSVDVKHQRKDSLL